MKIYLIEIYERQNDNLKKQLADIEKPFKLQMDIADKQTTNSKKGEILLKLKEIYNRTNDIIGTDKKKGI